MKSGYFQSRLFEIKKIKAKFGEEELTKTLQQYGIADNIEQLSRQQLAYIEKFDNAFQLRERIRKEYEVEANRIIEANKEAKKIEYEDLSDTERNTELSGREASEVSKVQEKQQVYQTELFNEEITYSSTTANYPKE